MIEYSLLSDNLGKVQAANAGLLKAIVLSRWAPGIFQDGIRQKKNFLHADCIGLDIDSGATLEHCINLLDQAGYKYIVGTTKSHGLEKNGIIADRFRVVLFPGRRINNAVEYEATWKSLQEVFPFIDPAAKDCSRYFEPCKEITNVKEEGKLVPVKTELPSTKAEKPERVRVTEGIRGKPSYKTLEYLAFGAEPGEWNGRLHEAAADFRAQGYEEDEFINVAERMAQDFDGELDEQDLRTITSAYTAEYTFEPRLTKGQSLIKGAL